MQALILAAGMGKRLNSEHNKCMVKINELTLWERFVNSLKKASVERVIIVTGYHAEQLETFILEHSEGVQVQFIRNQDYEITNNIWSLYLAKPYLNADTILLESDLIFEKDLLRQLCDCNVSDMAVVAKYENWMDGTTVYLKDGYIQKIIPKKDIGKYDIDRLHKTVNIYKFSKEFLQEKYIPALQKYIEEHGKNEYYEIVLKEIVEENHRLLTGFELESKWYEIDTQEDLKKAEIMFSSC